MHFHSDIYLRIAYSSLCTDLPLTERNIQQFPDKKKKKEFGKPKSSEHLNLSSFLWVRSEYCRNRYFLNLYRTVTTLYMYTYTHIYMLYSYMFYIYKTTLKSSFLIFRALSFKYLVFHKLTIEFITPIDHILISWDSFGAAKCISMGCCFITTEIVYYKFLLQKKKINICFSFKIKFAFIFCTSGSRIKQMSAIYWLRFSG